MEGDRPEVISSTPMESETVLDNGAVPNEALLNPEPVQTPEVVTPSEVVQTPEAVQTPTPAVLQVPEVQVQDRAELSAGAIGPSEEDVPGVDVAAPSTEEAHWPGWPGESVFRMVVPVHKVGSIIGRKGEFVKRMSEESRARIRIIEGIQGIDERVVLVCAREEPDNPRSPAIEGLLRVHRQLVEGVEGDAKEPLSEETLKGTITARLLVPATQAGSLIGRQGATIKGFQESSGANIRVLPNEELPLCALEDDRLVEVSGAVRSVYAAVEVIAQHLRKFLVDKSVLMLFETNRLITAQKRAPPPAAPPPSTTYAWPTEAPRYAHYPTQPDPYAPPEDYYSQAAPRSHYNAPPHSSQYAPPQQPVPGAGRQGVYAAPPTSTGYAPQQYAPSEDRQAAVDMYGRDPSAGGARAPPPPTAPVVSIKEVTANMAVPVAYTDAIIGVHGANIEYLRRTSGANVSIHESVSASSGQAELTVEIKGTTQQVQTAEQLLQSYMAAGPTSAQPTGAYQAAAAAAQPAAASYASYAAQGAQYASTADPYYQRQSQYPPPAQDPPTYSYGGY